MTAPLSLADVDWREVLVAGLFARYGITATADTVAPLVCGCREVICDGDHLWITPTPAQSERAGGAA